jgi:hypothetical protein
MTKVQTDTQIRIETSVLFSKMLSRSAILAKYSAGTKMGQENAKKFENLKT